MPQRAPASCIGNSGTHTGTVTSERTAMVAVTPIASTCHSFVSVPNAAHIVAATANRRYPVQALACPMLKLFHPENDETCHDERQVCHLAKGREPRSTGVTRGSLTPRNRGQ